MTPTRIYIAALLLVSTVIALAVMWVLPLKRPLRPKKTTQDRR